MRAKGATGEAPDADAGDAADTIAEKAEPTLASVCACAMLVALDIPSSSKLQAHDGEVMVGVGVGVGVVVVGGGGSSSSAR